MKQIAKEKTDLHLNKRLAEKNPKNSTDHLLIVAYNTNLDSHQKNHLNSKITFKPSRIEIEKVLLMKTFRKMSTICDGLINQYKPNYKTAFSARFDKQDENDQVLNEVELFNNLKFNQN